MSKTPFSPYWCWESEIPSDICDKIVEAHKKDEWQDGTINTLDGEKTTVENSYRNVDVCFSDKTWINAMVHGYIHYANSHNFEYELSLHDLEPGQISRYKEGQFYKKHMDFGPNRNNATFTRKLSLTLQLSDSDEYEGGDLVLNSEGLDVNGEDTFTFTRAKGSIIVFDSKVIHQVTPVTSGIRYSLVKWAHGEKPFR